MLGDNPERSKNPLKKAMRRRNAKTVQFSDPTYYEASEVDYSSDEDEAGGSQQDGDVEVDENEARADDRDDEITAVEPLRPSGQRNESNGVETAEPASTPSRVNEVQERPNSQDAPSEDGSDQSGE